MYSEIYRAVNFATVSRKVSPRAADRKCAVELKPIDHGALNCLYGVMSTIQYGAHRIVNIDIDILCYQVSGGTFLRP